MLPTIILAFFNLLCAGLLAGMEFAIHYGLRSPATVLADSAQLQLRQAMVRRLRVLVPAIFAPTLLTGIAATVVAGTLSANWWRGAALLALLIWIVIRVIGTVPINSATMDWSLAAPPADWKAQVDHAERFHTVGVWAAVLAFAGFLVSSLH